MYVTQTHQMLGCLEQKQTSQTDTIPLVLRHQSGRAHAAREQEERVRKNEQQKEGERGRANERVRARVRTLDVCVSACVCVCMCERNRRRQSDHVGATRDFKQKMRTPYGNIHTQREQYAIAQNHLERKPAAEGSR